MADRIPCPRRESDGCEGYLEMSTKVYFDITGTPGEDKAVIEGIEPSMLNDLFDGTPLNNEGELFVGCDNCGHEPDFEFSPEILAKFSTQSARMRGEG